MEQEEAGAGPRQQFRLTPTWPQQISPADSEELLAFWKSENAIPDATQARARLPQVAVLARDEAGVIAGVCTALAVTPPQLGQPVYYWRTFVAPRWRKTRLFHQLGMASFQLLEDWAREHDYPCIGILLELENARFGKIGRMPVWGRSGFTYIGKSGRGLDMRVRWFKGARLR